jgi:hypothetical protein
VTTALAGRGGRHGGKEDCLAARCGNRGFAYGVGRAQAMAYRDARGAGITGQDWSNIEAQLRKAYRQLKLAIVPPARTQASQPPGHKRKAPDLAGAFVFGGRRSIAKRRHAQYLTAGPPQLKR